MADARLIHKRGSHGDRVVALSHLEHRVWVQYVLSADDYGVMRASASVIRADNPRLERERVKVIEQAMSTIVASTLVATFIHQAVTFWWQLDWQDFQQIRHPRGTVNPCPSSDDLSQATALTRELFRKHPAQFRKDFGNETETFPPLAGGGARETLTLTLTPTLPRSGSAEESARETAVDSSDGVQPVWGHGRKGALARTDGLVQPTHPKCDPATFAACNRGMCVPWFLSQQWRAQLGLAVDVASEAIRAFVARALATLAPGAVGDDPLKFWRAAWGAEHGSQAPVAPVTTNTREGRIMAGAKAAMERAR